MGSCRQKLSTVIIGAGSIGISTAYYLAKKYGQSAITLVDMNAIPMSFTSAQSGENYRNWWPHPNMTAFTNDSIDLLEDIAKATNNRIAMTRRGYVLATRKSNIDSLLSALQQGDATGQETGEDLRFHTGPTSNSYRGFGSGTWEEMPSGVDVLQNTELIQKIFKSHYDEEIETVLHIRRGGDINSHELGSYMLECLRGKLTRATGMVQQIEQDKNGLFTVHLDNQDIIQADCLVNAAGPFANSVAGMLGVELPIVNVFQQKIAFEDVLGAIPRTLPFSIDLDTQTVDWTEEERGILGDDPQYAWLTEQMPGAVHCRPDGGDNSRWVKLGWAYNSTPQDVSTELPTDQNFPEIVIRGSARLNPSLQAYYGNMPFKMHHYGGWYTMTTENWPLIGPMGPDGAYINGAMSGFGTMAACAAGSLCADWIVNKDCGLPEYAENFSLARYQDTSLMKSLEAADKGVL